MMQKCKKLENETPLAIHAIGYWLATGIDSSGVVEGGRGNAVPQIFLEERRSFKWRKSGNA